jgi:hypothetical protein
MSAYVALGLIWDKTEQSARTDVAEERNTAGALAKKLEALLNAQRRVGRLLAAFCMSLDSLAANLWSGAATRLIG